MHECVLGAHENVSPVKRYAHRVGVTLASFSRTDVSYSASPGPPPPPRAQLGRLGRWLG